MKLMAIDTKLAVVINTILFDSSRFNSAKMPLSQALVIWASGPDWSALTVVTVSTGWAAMPVSPGFPCDCPSRLLVWPQKQISGNWTVLYLSS